MNEKIELCFVWIGEHKLFQDASFNFSNRQIISYNLERNSLVVNENKNFIAGFFEKNITNITAVVGKNGSGKTTLLKYIQNGLPDLQSSNLVVYLKKDTLHILYNKLKTRPIVEFQGNLKYRVEYYDFEHKYNDSEDRIIQNLGITNIVYYSNSFSSSQE